MLYIHTHTHKSCSIWWIKSGSFGTLHALLGKLLNIRKTSSQNFGPQTGYPGVYCSIYTVPPRTRWGITSKQVTAASFTIHHSWSFRHRWCVGYLHYHLLLQRSWFVIRRRSHSQVYSYSRWYAMTAKMICRYEALMFRLALQCRTLPIKTISCLFTAQMLTETHSIAVRHVCNIHAHSGPVEGLSVPILQICCGLAREHYVNPVIWRGRF